MQIRHITLALVGVIIGTAGFAIAANNRRFADRFHDTERPGPGEIAGIGRQRLLAEMAVT